MTSNLALHLCALFSPFLLLLQSASFVCGPPPDRAQVGHPSVAAPQQQVPLAPPRPLLRTVPEEEVGQVPLLVPDLFQLEKNNKNIMHFI